MIEPVDWSATYIEYSQRIYNYFYRRISDSTLAEDLTSDLFIKAIEAERNGSGSREHFRGWLFRIAHNLVIDHYRARNRGQSVSFDDMPEMVDPDNDPIVAAERNYTNATIQAALMRLTDNQREVLELRFLEGHSHEEIAARLGKGVLAVRALQHRGLNHANLMLSKGKIRPVLEFGTNNVIEDLLTEYGPLTIRQMIEISGKSRKTICAALHNYPGMFKPMDSVRIERYTLNVWGLVGVHDLREAA